MQQIEFTNALRNHLISQVEIHAEQEQIKGKKLLHLQYVFFNGAIATIDFLNNNGKSCFPPDVYVSMIRSELIKRKEESESTQHTKVK